MTIWEVAERAAEVPGLSAGAVKNVTRFFETMARVAVELSWDTRQEFAIRPRAVRICWLRHLSTM